MVVCEVVGKVVVVCEVVGKIVVGPLSSLYAVKVSWAV